MRKWDKIGLTCTNGNLAVLCAGKNNCPPNMEWRCGGWRKVFNMKFNCVLRICMKFIRLYGRYLKGHPNDTLYFQLLSDSRIVFKAWAEKENITTTFENSCKNELSFTVDDEIEYPIEPVESKRSFEKMIFDSFEP